LVHVELSRFPHSARAFNLSQAELAARILEPWLRGETVELGDRSWDPKKADLVIYEGPELRPDELSMGRGWANAMRAGEDVTAKVLAETAPQARRSASQAGPPALEQFKEDVLAQCAGGRIGVHQVMWLAGTRFPQARPSERLALAEQAVWELLHQDRLRMVGEAGPVPASEWERIVLAWDTWAGTGAATVLLERI
jgi:hypothetical protein